MIALWGDAVAIEPGEVELSLAIRPDHLQQAAQSMGALLWRWPITPPVPPQQVCCRRIKPPLPRSIESRS
jgi:hypothetical protein